MPVSHLVEQLWRPAVEQGDARLTWSEDAAGPWTTAERYLVLPSATRARMLLPASPRAATVGSLMNYRGLRRRLPNLQRTVLGVVAKTPAPLPFPELRVQVRSVARRDGARPPDVLPLDSVKAVLGRDDVFAAIGIRTGANRKATLQLVDASGAPVGYAKFAWSTSTADGIARERDALGTPTVGAARAPALLGSGTYADWPWIVTAPLPLSCRGVRADVPAPRPDELHSLAPLVRRARAHDTGQLRALADRVSALDDTALDREIAAAIRALLGELSHRGTELPVTSRWHGDLTPWNSARDAQGTLWVWDWESSEPDAVAGLDAVHWHLTVETESGRVLGPALLAEAFTRAHPALIAAGVPRSGWPEVLAVYVATLAERACSLAAGEGGWEETWVLPDQLLAMLGSARGQMTGA